MAREDHPRRRLCGEIPGAPPETCTVQLPGIYGKTSMPARFLPSPPETLVGGTTGTPPTVFWDFSAAQSLVCGVPPSTDLVCVLGNR
jgi:hypothetical protein